MTYGGQVGGNGEVSGYIYSYDNNGHFQFCWHKVEYKEYNTERTVVMPNRINRATIDTLRNHIHWTIIA